MVADKFVEHLEELYEHYRPETDNLPTADQILSGMLNWPKKLTFDQSLWLINQCAADLQALLLKYNKSIYGAKSNVLVDARMERFFAQVLKWKSVEMQAIAMRTVLVTYGVVANPKNVPSLDKLITKLKPYTMPE